MQQPGSNGISSPVGDQTGEHCGHNEHDKDQRDEANHPTPTAANGSLTRYALMLGEDLPDSVSVLGRDQERVPLRGRQIGSNAARSASKQLGANSLPA